MIRDTARPRFVPAGALPLVVSSLLAACGGGGGGRGPDPVFRETSAGCLSCHGGIEDLHVRFELGCTDCHGGDATTTDLARAHVFPAGRVAAGAGVEPRDDADLPYLRFFNPSDFRVLPRTCGRTGAGSGTNCHEAESLAVTRSLMATDAGIWQSLFFSSGLRGDRAAGFGVFAEADADQVPAPDRETALSLEALPVEAAALPETSPARHASVLPRESCVRCHLWSTGAGVRGESGHEGLYRSSGCAACHLLYDDDGLYRGGDPTIDKSEKGHGSLHFVTLEIPTEQCAHCHNDGGLDVGLSYRGLATVPPGIPAGPGVPGTTSDRRYGKFLLDDGFYAQPDVHALSGMACIDCHTVLEAHGDGNIDVSMSLATEIRCEDCHGTIDADSALVTSRGNPLPHLRREGDFVILRGKLDGIDRVVRQVRQVIDPASPLYNPSGAAAMTPEHLKPEGMGGLECYACHATWQKSHVATEVVRDFAAAGRDLFTDALSPGAIEDAAGNAYPSRPFLERLRPFGLGRNVRGRIAPLAPSRAGFLASAAGAGAPPGARSAPTSGGNLLGLAQDAGFPHTTSQGARDCNECHRNPGAMGLGGDGLEIARRLLALAAGPEGVVLADRSLAGSVSFLSRVAAADARAVLLENDPATGAARTLFVADGAGGLLVADVTAPDAPLVLARLATTEAKGLAAAGSHLLVADGPGGVRVVDVSSPNSPRLVATVATTDARAIAVAGPFAYVADGAGGLAVLDVGDPSTPALLEAIDLDPADPGPCDARAVEVFPLLSPIFGTFKAYQTVAAVADGGNGLKVLDVTDPAFRFVFATVPATEAADVDYASVFLPGAGGTGPREADWLVVTDPVDGLLVVEVGAFFDAVPVGSFAEPLFSPVASAVAFEAGPGGVPRLLAHAATADGAVRVVDLTDPAAPVVTALAALAGAGTGVALETIDPMRRADEDGRPLLESAGGRSRPLGGADIRRILRTEYP